ncbi:MAG: hypothetical protein ACFFCQ_08705 [Promethearchaeota archaeon]
MSRHRTSIKDIQAMITKLAQKGSNIEILDDKDRPLKLLVNNELLRFSNLKKAEEFLIDLLKKE